LEEIQEVVVGVESSVELNRFRIVVEVMNGEEDG
jgi:hypothetical protein